MLGAPAPGDNIHEQFHRLLLSERTFVQDVTAFYRRVVRRLTMEADYDRRVASSTDPASSSDAARVRVPSAAVAHRHHVRRCFDNVARLVFVHDAFLDDLERTLSRIGHGHNLADALIDCFAANLPGLTFHAEYAADLPIAIGVLSWRASRDSPLQRFIGDASPDGRPEYLFEQLRLPLARVPQYLQVMLVVRDLKPKRVAFVDVIVQALTTTLAAVIDPAPFPAAAANEIMEVEDQLKDPIDLVRPGRTLVRSGIVHHRRRSCVRPGRTTILHMCNDVMLVATRRRFKQRLVDVFALADLNAFDVSDDKNGVHQIVLRSRTSDQTMSIRMANADLKNGWLIDIWAASSAAATMCQRSSLSSSGMPCKTPVPGELMQRIRSLSAQDNREGHGGDAESSDDGDDDDDGRVPAVVVTVDSVLASLRHDQLAFCLTMSHLATSWKTVAKSNRSGRQLLGEACTALHSLARAHIHLLSMLNRLPTLTAAEIVSSICDAVPEIRALTLQLMRQEPAMRRAFDTVELQVAIDAFEMDPKSQQFPLSAFLGAPRCRLSYYVAVCQQLEDVLAYDGDERERAAVGNAREALNDVVSEIRFAVWQNEQRVVLEECQAQFKRYRRPPLLMGGGLATRCLLLTGTIGVMKSSITLCTFMLFSDYLLWSRPRRDASLALERCVRLERVQVSSDDTIQSSSSASRLLLVLHVPERVTLCFTSAQQRCAWFSALVDAILSRKAALLQDSPPSSTRPTPHVAT
ncbi:unnamed protein product (mitochondrion) [Plasmodiophora brassicae]|uniref:DH domain-containing protein n=1 Tax=Plasmodiophora brassicae TaxID=37360 RepID=A0A0G4IJ57_PLABS|nr:hypothetical protein PBRA_003970 [Plasmodiophora brassicae]SPQ96348.1 unnamed protein product [Plasmodiophora brassicae]